MLKRAMPERRTNRQTDRVRENEQIRESVKEVYNDGEMNQRIRIIMYHIADSIPLHILLIT